MKTFLKVLAVLICMWIGVWVLYTVGSMLLAKPRVTQGRYAAIQSMDQLMAHVVQMVMDSGIVVKRLGSSKTDICNFSSRDSGFFVSEWHQRCYLHYLEGFSTDFDEASVKERLASVFEETSTIDGQFGFQDCSSYDPAYSGKIILFLPEHTMVDHNLTDEGLPAHCGIPNQGDISSSKEAMAYFKTSPAAVKKLQTFDENAVDNTHKQIWIIFNRDYYDEFLGCTHIMSIFCDNPRPFLITAD